MNSDISLNLDAIKNHLDTALSCLDVIPDIRDIEKIKPEVALYACLGLAEKAHGLVKLTLDLAQETADLCEFEPKDPGSVEAAIDEEVVYDTSNHKR